MLWGVLGIVAIASSLAALPWAYEFDDVFVDDRFSTERYNVGVEELSNRVDNVASDGGPGRAGLANYLRWGVYTCGGVAATAAALARGRASLAAPAGIVVVAALVHTGFAVYLAVDLPQRPGPGPWAFLVGLVALAASTVTGGSSLADAEGVSER